MDAPYLIMSFFLMGTYVLSLASAGTRDSSQDMHFFMPRDDMRASIHQIAKLLLTLALWCAFSSWACEHALHLTYRSLLTLRFEGTMLQRATCFCLTRWMPVLFLSIPTLFFASDEFVARRRDIPACLAFVGNALLDALALPLGFVTLLAGSTASGSRDAGTAELASSLLGMAFLVCLICGILSLGF